MTTWNQSISTRNKTTTKIKGKNCSLIFIAERWHVTQTGIEHVFFCASNSQGIGTNLLDRRCDRFKFPWVEAHAFTNSNTAVTHSSAWKTAYGDVDGFFNFISSTCVQTRKNSYCQVVYFKTSRICCPKYQRSIGEVGRLDKYFKDIMVGKNKINWKV